jgi:glyoxylase-like metal-dependent hydrolase (beta-lactamase superfamily II)
MSSTILREAGDRGMSLSNRRDFCRLMLGGATGLLASKTAFAAAQGGPAALSVTKLTDSLSLIRGAGSNVLLFNAADSVLMVDGGSAERSAELLKLVESESAGRPVRVLFNTHWHLDATGSNDTLGKAGVKIIAHENTRLWMGTEFHVQWQNRTYKPRAKEARPNETIYTTGRLKFGNEEIRYGHLGQAHTDGDLYVFFPAANILFTGDLFTVGSYPVLDWSTGGWIGGLARANTTLISLTNDQTKVVPGSGPVQTQADLKELASMVETVRKRVYDFIGRGMTAGDMYRQAPTKEFDAKWGNPSQFIANIYPGLWNHVRELGPEAHGIV